MRFEKSPGLFGGSGVSTCGDIRCQLCNQPYNEGEDKRGVYDGDGIPNEDFAGLEICFCCFERIEEEIWARRHVVLEWLHRRAMAQYGDADKTLKTATKALVLERAAARRRKDD